MLVLAQNKTEYSDMTELRTSLNIFNTELGEFSKDFEKRLCSLGKSLKYPSITSASSYRECLQDLNSRVMLVDTVLNDIAGKTLGDDPDFSEYLHNVEAIFKEIDSMTQTSSGEKRLEKEKRSSTRPEESIDLPVVMADRRSSANMFPERYMSESSPDVWSPSIQKLMGKYGPGQADKGSVSPVFAAALKEQEALLETDTDLAAKYAHESIDEDNTLELKSQVIFSLKSANKGALDKPEPIEELDDLGPTPSKMIDDRKLEDAISAALAKCEVKGITPNVSNISSRRSSASQFPSSAPRTANTPKLPTSLPPYCAVEASSYSCLPSFIRGQIALEDLNHASSRIHALVTKRHATGEGITFNSADVEEHADLAPGKSKVFLNALAKLDRIQLKVIYGQGTVYFFV